MKSKGFTLLEVIAAIFVLTVGVGGSVILIQQTLSAASMVESKLIASYLAQEGIEIAKNLRDTAALKRRTQSLTVSWDEYFPEGERQADYLGREQELNLISNEGLLYIDANGFYSHSASGNPTKFKRRISVLEKTDLDGDEIPDKLKVSIEVEWKERGRTHSIKVLEYITNWYEKRKE